MVPDIFRRRRRSPAVSAINSACALGSPVTFWVMLCPGDSMLHACMPPGPLSESPSARPPRPPSSASRIYLSSKSIAFILWPHRHRRSQTAGRSPVGPSDQPFRVCRSRPSPCRSRWYLVAHAGIEPPRTSAEAYPTFFMRPTAFIMSFSKSCTGRQLRKEIHRESGVRPSCLIPLANSSPAQRPHQVEKPFAVGTEQHRGRCGDFLEYALVETHPCAVPAFVAERLCCSCRN